MTIGENIRRIRKEKGYTQKQLAGKCEMYESQIRKYELGKANPKIETLKKMAAALDCQISDIDEDIIIIPIPVFKPTPEDIERYKKDAEARKIIERQEAGEQITKEEKEIVSDYIKYIRDSFSQLPERMKEIGNKLDEIGENFLLANYRKLNREGKSEAIKRVNELTEIPRYTKPPEPPQE